MNVFSWFSKLLTARNTEESKESRPPRAVSEVPRFETRASDGVAQDDEYSPTVPNLKILDDPSTGAESKGGFDPYDTVQFHASRIDRKNRDD
ncbi:MAG: hypothetical protein AAFN50_00885 [Pseudomonadota bacterium]